MFTVLLFCSFFVLSLARVELRCHACSGVLHEAVCVALISVSSSMNSLILPQGEGEMLGTLGTHSASPPGQEDAGYSQPTPQSQRKN